MVRGMPGFNQEIMDMCVEAGSQSKSDRIYLHIGIVLGLEFARNFIENRQKMAFVHMRRLLITGARTRLVRLSSTRLMFC